MNIRIPLIALASLAAALSGCTGQIPNSFRLSQQEELFSSTQEVNTKLDMLWVIDSSGSMNVSQDRIREGFVSFATKYMKPTWDIRVAVITTDTYLANPAFAQYLNSTMISPSSSYRSSYLRGITANGIPGRSTPFTNPSWAPTLYDLNPSSTNYGKLTNGLKVSQDRPQWGPNWAKLLPGYHDGPQLVLCHEANGGYISGSGFTRCFLRDDQTGNTGPDRCAFPSGTETATQQCVNTSMNNTARSGKAIISTQPPAGTPADAAWSDGLIRDFLVNLSVGIQGSGYERGLGSIQQLLSDNEYSGSPTAFFRENSLRVIVLVGDEDDQTMIIPSTIPNGYGPGSNYFSSCSKTIDGVQFSLPICPDPSKLVPVAQIKDQLDSFFHGLDGTAAGASPNYFVVSIVAASAASVTQLRNERGTGEIDRADRFIELGNLVGNGSVAMDIASSDYSPILDAIGRSVVQKKALFQLKRAPTGEEDMIVWVVHADGSRDIVPSDRYVISGSTLEITDLDFVLGLSSTDQILINYQPKTLS